MDGCVLCLICLPAPLRYARPRRSCHYARRLCPIQPLNQACGPSTKRCCFFRYSLTLSSHCSQVYLHSKITLFILFVASRASLPVALCFVSTVLLVLFVFSYWSVALLLSESPRASCSLLLHDLLPVPSRHDHPVLLTNICLFLSLYHLVSLHPAKGFASQAPEYILFTLPRHFIVKFAHLSITHRSFSR